jgi:hypothetical protein
MIDSGMSVVIFILGTAVVAVPRPAHPDIVIINAEKTVTIAFAVMVFTLFAAGSIFHLLSMRIVEFRGVTQCRTVPPG